MLINLLEEIIIHPYADQDALSILTMDSRDGKATNLYDGLVYHEVRGSKHVLMEGYCRIADGILRTTIPLLSEGIFRCMHTFQAGRTKYNRATTLRLRDGMLVISSTDSQPGVGS